MNAFYLYLIIYICGSNGSEDNIGSTVFQSLMTYSLVRNYWRCGGSYAAVIFKLEYRGNRSDRNGSVYAAGCMLY
jgi:hypothetical protein